MAGVDGAPGATGGRRAGAARGEAAGRDDEVPALSELEPDDEPEDDEDADLATYRRVVPVRKGGKVLRQLPVPAPAAPAWWVGKDRESFAQEASKRAEELRSSPAAAKVKTPMNFVGGA